VSDKAVCTTPHPRGRREIPPPENYRGTLQCRHFCRLSDGKALPGARFSAVGKWAILAVTSKNKTW